jgi:hypothetical protein
MVDRPVGVDQDTRASSLANFPQLRRLAGLQTSREPLFILRDLRLAKAINARSEKISSRSAQSPLPLLQRVPMLASRRRSSWPKSDQEMVAAVTPREERQA